MLWINKQKIRFLVHLTFSKKPGKFSISGKVPGGGHSVGGRESLKTKKKVMGRGGNSSGSASDYGSRGPRLDSRSRWELGFSLSLSPLSLSFNQ